MPHRGGADKDVGDEQIELIGQDVAELGDAVPDAGGEDGPYAPETEVRKAEDQIGREPARVKDIGADRKDRGGERAADHEAQPGLEEEKQAQHRDGVEDPRLREAQGVEIEGVGDVIAVGVDGEEELQDEVQKGQGIGQLDLPDQRRGDLKERIQIAHAQDRRHHEDQREDRVGHADGGEVLPRLLRIAARALEHDEAARHGVERDGEQRGIARKIVRELEIAVGVAAELLGDARRDIEADEEVQHESDDAEHHVFRERPAAEIFGMRFCHGGIPFIFR